MKINEGISVKGEVMETKMDNFEVTYTDTGI